MKTRLVGVARVYLVVVSFTVYCASIWLIHIAIDNYNRFSDFEDPLKRRFLSYAPLVFATFVSFTSLFGVVGSWIFNRRRKYSRVSLHIFLFLTIFLWVIMFFVALLFFNYQELTTLIAENDSYAHSIQDSVLADTLNSWSLALFKHCCDQTAQIFQCSVDLCADQVSSYPTDYSDLSCACVNDYPDYTSYLNSFSSNDSVCDVDIDFLNSCGTTSSTPVAKLFQIEFRDYIHDMSGPFVQTLVISSLVCLFFCSLAVYLLTTLMPLDLNEQKKPRTFTDTDTDSVALTDDGFQEIILS